MGKTLVASQTRKILIAALRKAHPDLPVVIHTHDTAGTGVASMLECAREGADAVDVALPAMSGLTAQPTVAAIKAGLSHTPRAIEVDTEAIRQLNAYWELARGLYAPFETGLTGYAPDLYEHEIPGGQYTNLRFQAQQLGLLERWEDVKRSYAAANRLLGDIVKVTPSSKVVGDLAQFMVQNELDEAGVRAQASTLSFPQSVVDFFAGRIGQPYGGFPEPLRSQVLRDGERIDGRFGASLADFDFDRREAELEESFRGRIRDVDVMSAALYPKVFREYREFKDEFGDVSVVPTRFFLAPPEPNVEFTVEIERGKTLVVKLTAVGELDERGYREVFFELNGQPRRVEVRDEGAEQVVAEREKADASDPKSVGAPMPGTVIEVRVAKGDDVEPSTPLVVLSAMKMETVVGAPDKGTVQRIAVAEGDVLAPGDLIVELR